MRCCCCCCECLGEDEDEYDVGVGDDVAVENKAGIVAAIAVGVRDFPRKKRRADETTVSWAAAVAVAVVYADNEAPCWRW